MAKHVKNFLVDVAYDILEKCGKDMSDLVVVFPNKRASLFLNEYLARKADGPIWAPTYTTISDLFRHHSDLAVADPIKLVCDLHKSFVKCTGIEETLDHFYGWGQLLITDFDDIDKNMADAEKVFANLKDIHELDDVSYLTDEQKRMIQKFFSNFSDDHNSELKKRFLQLWSHFLDIYQDFNARLAEQGLAYEGALYRQVVQSDIQFEHQMYLFVGFNMMQEVELQLCDKLQKEGKAAFYWDYDNYYMQNDHEAGHYIRQYLQYYPDEFANKKHEYLLDNKKSIQFISAPTENIQARYVNTWLSENDRLGKGNRAAIVLADESLLPAVIHSLPKTDKPFNITIGYPLQQSPFYSLVQQLIQLQGIGHPKDSNTYRLHYVLRALRHPYAKHISARYADVIKSLEEKKRFYPSHDSLVLDGDEDLALLFQPLDAEDVNAYNLALVHYLLDILKLIGVHTKGQEDALFQESLYRTYTLINRLKGLVESDDLQVDTITLERLILQLFQTTNVPFHGEPAEGIQIMGVLETRNLDFTDMLILSCNEGKLPKGVNDSSFIPYSIRKAYGLTTVDNKVAIYAYYFYRMIQRAKNITFTYNNATDNGQTGEMSRFMLQLLVDYKSSEIKRYTLSAGQTPQPSEYKEVEKTDEMLAKIDEIKMLTPSLLNTYMRCEKRFYYKYVEGLKEPDEIDEDEVDNRVFGNIFHRAAELFYLRFVSPSNLVKDAKGKTTFKKPVVITEHDMDEALKDTSLVYRLVEQAFKEELFKVTDNDFKPKYNGLQLINKEVIASYLRQLLTIDSRNAPFTILGLELVVSKDIEVPLGEGNRTFKVGGFIDRLDAIPEHGSSMAQHIRVIDYKTGAVPQTHPKELAEVFDPSKLNKHTDYYLQALLYSTIVKHDAKLNPASDPVSPGLLFIQKARCEDYDPTLLFGREKILDVTDYEKEFMEGISKLIANIYDKSIPFGTTTDAQRCKSCPYAQLCR